MLFFGHIGITVGIIKACDMVTSAKVGTDSHALGSRQDLNTIGAKKIPSRLLWSIRNRVGFMDYRLVLLGSLLPDILDKPSWLFVDGDFFDTGRGYAHILIFNLALLILSP